MAPKSRPKPRRVVAQTRAYQRADREYQRDGEVISYRAVLNTLPEWMRADFDAPTSYPVRDRYPLP